MRVASARAWLIGTTILLVAAATGVGTSIMWDRQKRNAVAIAMTGGNPAMAPPIFRKYGCTGCHTIPGIPGADGRVGGPLTDMRQRVYVGGVMNNTPKNMVRWIVSPPTFSPGTAMPVTGISQHEAKDLAAYLYAR
ncbi:cytochrome C [Rhizobium sp. XQZ8]|uniref:c-type cytochrome n=1 Tax=Rhizobium populisoli TaxID=2859785 RepID=UPI001CA58932|nr:cytochrome C [Rhizobium populisoli]MBW6425397.1 cytochrome C [Rhizobium populisoli]